MFRRLLCLWLWLFTVLAKLVSCLIPLRWLCRIEILGKFHIGRSLQSRILEASRHLLEFERTNTLSNTAMRSGTSRDLKTSSKDTWRTL